MMGKYRNCLLWVKKFYCWKSARGFATKQPSSEWTSVIGLEVHAQIATASKLFSSGSPAFESLTNSCVNLFDAGMPGTLPVLNKKAVEMAVLTSLALKCKVNSVSSFDRKHYFYSDLPNGYQITQQRSPLAESGYIDFMVYEPSVHKEPYHKRSYIKQIQIEQDSGRSLYQTGELYTLIDLNRSGIALMEIVFEPDLRDAEEAAALLNELVSILRRLGSCSCKMEEGALRVDVNVSIRKEGDEMGVRTEIKNIGSIHGARKAINCEVARQVNLIESGGVVTNQTLAWSPAGNRVIVMREKEGKDDYRFMPEPNLLPLRLKVDDESDNCHKTAKNAHLIMDLRHLRDGLPDLPEAERKLVLEKYGASKFIAFEIVRWPVLYKYFIDIMSEDSSRNVRKVFNFLKIDLLTALGKLELELNDCRVPSSHLGEILDMKSSTLVTKGGAVLVLEELLKGDLRSPRVIAEERNLITLSDDELRKLVTEVIDENPKAVADFARGKKRVLNFFVGHILKRSHNRVPKVSAEEMAVKLLEEKIRNG